MIGHVESIERTQEEGAEVTNVLVNFGGDDTTAAEFFEPSGQDAPPLKGDAASLYDSTESGSSAVVGFNDPKNPGKALPGERREYARAEDGSEVSEIWLKRDGSGEITGLKSGWKILMGTDGSISLNGFVIDKDGNAKTPGEVTAMSESAPVKLSSHLHPTGVGPSGAPTPGT